MKYKVHLYNDLDFTMADLEEPKRDNAQKLQGVIIKESKKTNKSDAKLEISLLNMKDMQSKTSDIEVNNKDIG